MENDEHLRTEYDGTLPIEYFFQQIQYARDFAITTKYPYDDKNILEVEITTLTNSAIITEACREWNLDKTPQTWTNFKTFFLKHIGITKNLHHWQQTNQVTRLQSRPLMNYTMQQLTTETR